MPGLEGRRYPDAQRHQKNRGPNSLVDIGSAVAGARFPKAPRWGSKPSLPRALARTPTRYARSEQRERIDDLPKDLRLGQSRGAMY